MTLEQARQDLKTLQAKMSAFDHAISLISYDGATSAPKGTASNRGQSLAILSEEAYTLSTCSQTVELLEYLDANNSQLTDEEKRQVFLLLKDLRQMRKVPVEEYVAYQRLLVESQDVWHSAKQNNDFASFEPYLKKIFDINLKFAGYFAPDKHPYDFWLGEFEEGVTMQMCDEFFNKVRGRLVPLIKKINEQIDDSFLKFECTDAQQDQLSNYLMDVIGLDKNRVGLSTTEHPFTTSLGSHLDERITTHYYKNDFTSSMYSVIHEGGHALYDTGCRDEYAYTALDCGVSMGIHESQSRFYENIIGRSLDFVNLIYPKVQEIFPQLANHSAKEFWRAINKVTPSLIRTEADEVTYCLHVMVRYQLEKQVMCGQLSVHDLPTAWNSLYKEYLGVDVPDDTHGILQDSHWSGGAIGYFPSYALGSAYGAQILKRMCKDIDVQKCVSSNDIASINAWNKQNIWQYGRLYSPKQLLERVLGEDFDADVYLDYLEHKVETVYNLQ